TPTAFAHSRSTGRASTCFRWATRRATSFVDLSRSCTRKELRPPASVAPLTSKPPSARSGSPTSCGRAEYAAFHAEARRLARQARTRPAAGGVRAFAVELRAIQAYLRDDLPAYARRVTCPTLVLHGSEDRVTPLVWGEELADMIPTARLRCIVG